MSAVALIPGTKKNRKIELAFSKGRNYRLRAKNQADATDWVVVHINELRARAKTKLDSAMAVIDDRRKRREAAEAHARKTGRPMPPPTPPGVSPASPETRVQEGAASTLNSSPHAQAIAWADDPFDDDTITSDNDDVTCSSTSIESDSDVAGNVADKLIVGATQSGDPPSRPPASACPATASLATSTPTTTALRLRQLLSKHGGDTNVDLAATSSMSETVAAALDRLHTQIIREHSFGEDTAMLHVMLDSLLSVSTEKPAAIAVALRALEVTKTLIHITGLGSSTRNDGNVDGNRILRYRELCWLLPSCVRLLGEGTRGGGNSSGKLRLHRLAGETLRVFTRSLGAGAQDAVVHALLTVGLRHRSVGVRYESLRALVEHIIVPAKRSGWVWSLTEANTAEWQAIVNGIVGRLFDCDSDVAQAAEELLAHVRRSITATQLDVLLERCSLWTQTLKNKGSIDYHSFASGGVSPRGGSSMHNNTPPVEAVKAAKTVEAAETMDAVEATEGVSKLLAREHHAMVWSQQIKGRAKIVAAAGISGGSRQTMEARVAALRSLKRYASEPENREDMYRDSTVVAVLTNGTRHVQNYTDTSSKASNAGGGGRHVASDMVRELSLRTLCSLGKAMGNKAMMLDNVVILQAFVTGARACEPSSVR